MVLGPRSRSYRIAFAAALVGLICLASGTSLQAQTTSAAVFGSVQDSQGGVLPGATITLTSRTQGNVLTTTTDAEGRFVFTIVRPDRYILRATMQGFKAYEQTNVVVLANDRFSAGVLVLEVGEMSESISVLARVSELQVESGERSFAMESETITNVANDGRSFFGFTTLVPGIVGTDGNENPGQVSDVSVNGQRPNANNITIDGVANIDTGNNGGNMATTNLDAVAEFKVLTNAYQAEYGRAVGGQVQVVTKSGTTEFHGSGYWYGRRSDWNANSWTNNRDGIEKTESSRNDYGYTIGGPIFIPGAFNEDKNKLFFFWSQEWQKRKDPASQRLTRTPTALERQGDFSQSVDNNGNPWPYIRDYTTGLPCDENDQSGCFADGGVLGRIPQDRLYQPGINGLNLYPLPNGDFGSGINYQSQAPNDQPRREELLRIDFQPTDRWRVTGRYMRNADLQFLPYGTTWAGAGSGPGGRGFDDMAVEFDHPGKNWMLSATGILNNTTSLEISVGQAENELIFNVTNPNLRRAAAGLSEMPLLFPQAVQDDYIPDLRFNGGRTGGEAGYYQTDRGPFTNLNRTTDILVNLTKVKGSHTLKAGFYYQNSLKPQTAFAPHNSRIEFIDDSNNPLDSNFSYANAALGIYRNYTQASIYGFPDWIYQNYEFYVQDNWKAGSKLTLDYGIRFYYMTPQWDEKLSASTFLPDRFDFANAATLYQPGCIGASPCSGDNRVGVDPNTGQTVEGRFIGRLTPGSDRFNAAFQAGQGINDTMQSGNIFRVSPRFGFVYDISGNYTTILRGGFGIFYDRPQGNMVFDQIANAPGLLEEQLTWGLLTDVGGGGGDPNPTLSMRPTEYEFTAPTVYAWNVGLQRKVASNLTFDIAYVGSKSEDLLSQDQINAVPYGAKFLPENQDPTRAPSSTPGATALPDDFLRPFQGYSGIRLWGYEGFSNYHSLQTSLTRRFDRGLMVSVFYVWSKALGINNGDFSTLRPRSSREVNKAFNYSYVDYDRPHNFVVNFIYQTPKVAEGALGYLANDWQLSGVYQWLSGAPYDIGFSIPGISAANLTGSDGGQNARVVVTCDPGKGSSGDPYQQINTACFAPPQTPSLGGESARYFLHRPPINNLNFSISKAIPMGSRVRFEVRLDMFNALNHTQWRNVRNSVSFVSQADGTVTNLPFDDQGNLVNQNGFGAINGVRQPRTIQLVTRLTF
jgi:hypothetical protein